ncbi:MULTISPECIES: hypothetical protein [Campylobacter]|uniref:hypothetical protein n=1 Tax=Campylobacter TaxID=194 RepID=UPI0023EFAD8C|nr:MULTISPECIES: hypothetical protein [Campylobacter]MCI6641514.1 hypothetical protein [Campylobacter sp.]MDD7422049.1 hypothetical protein [Campylobacter hominis]MDY3117234.1 hypothetical protein [Campylobacter hominis]
MFRRILGGIVLAAAGYGLKKYADEYGIFDKTISKDNKILNKNEVDGEKNKKEAIKKT